MLIIAALAQGGGYNQKWGGDWGGFINANHRTRSTYDEELFGGFMY